jgi:hypothetical protein
MGYFAQQSLDVLNADRTIIDQLQEDFPQEGIGTLRTLAGAFQFSGDDIDKKIRALSGGEKSRLAMARMLFNPPNFLVLDEPTNHLDLATKEMLVDALKNFEGTMIFVSHDRTFLRGSARACWNWAAKAGRIGSRWFTRIVCGVRAEPGPRSPRQSITRMRTLLVAARDVMVSCAAPPPPPAQKAAVDPGDGEWYAPAITELAGLNRESGVAIAGAASPTMRRENHEGAGVVGAAAVGCAPPLEAMEAAADNENLYAGMLLANKNFGWARLSYQKNVSRWKNWRPQTGGDGAAVEAGAGRHRGSG